MCDALFLEKFFTLEGEKAVLFYFIFLQLGYVEEEP